MSLTRERLSKLDKMEKDVQAIPDIMIPYKFKDTFFYHLNLLRLAINESNTSSLKIHFHRLEVSYAVLALSEIIFGLNLVSEKLQQLNERFDEISKNKQLRDKALAEVDSLKRITTKLNNIFDSISKNSTFWKMDERLPLFQYFSKLELTSLEKNLDDFKQKVLNTKCPSKWSRFYGAIFGHSLGHKGSNSTKVEEKPSIGFKR